MMRPLVLVLLALTGVARAAEWQFEVGLPGTRVHASMWIPPTCGRVRGILLGEQIILEDRVMQDPAIRSAATDKCLAMVLLSRGSIGDFDYKGKRDDKTLQAVLDALAGDSGYRELSSAPLLTIGHSGGAGPAWTIAYWNPSRVIAIIGLHSAVVHPPSFDPKATVEGIPVLGISGEYESWGQPDVPLDQHWHWLRGSLLEMRGQMKRPLVSLLVDPGGSHFSFNRPMADYVALFIRSAAEARLPQDSNPAGPLRDVPLDAGWLTDINPLNPGPGEHPPAPYALYSGDRSLAFWHLNRELALANENFRRDARGKRDQRVTCGQGGKLIPAAWMEDLHFQPEGDGMSFSIETGFLQKTPQGVAGSGRPLAHAAVLPNLSLIGGWFGGGEQTGPNTFRIRFGHLGPTDNLMVLASQSGSTELAYAEQPCQVKFPKSNTEGEAQNIEFAALADRTAGPADVPLKATASSGLPVEYYVVRGPAEVVGNTLHLSALPPGTRLPARVTVVAYQWGRSVGARVQSAPLVERTFLLNAPSASR